MNPIAAAVIPAAGSGTRMRSSLPKQYLDLDGKPILAHTISAFHSNKHIREIVVVVPEKMVIETEQLLTRFQLQNKAKVIVGGKRRQDSVQNGLLSLSQDVDIVLVHDGARPLISDDLICSCYEGAKQYGAAIAAIPVKDTLKEQGDDCYIKKTVDRSRLWQAQTPQAAKKTLLQRGFEAISGRDVTDEAAMLEAAGIPVKLIEGSETNLKITRPEDLVIAGKIIMQSEQTIRIGHGYDAHRLVPERELVLCGTKIEHDLGLEAHSDGDVATHALCDGILGALGRGDIGVHFPDSSAKFHNIYSILLLEQVVKIMQGDGYKIGNIDLTIICQKPKLAHHIEAMKTTIAKACATTTEQINIKATTTEKMGFTGREEGISCHCVVLLAKT